MKELILISLLFLPLPVYADQQLKDCVVEIYHEGNIYSVTLDNRFFRLPNTSDYDCVLNRFDRETNMMCVYVPHMHSDEQTRFKTTVKHRNEEVEFSLFIRHQGYIAEILATCDSE